MPCKLRYSLTTLAAIALVAASASSAAQAQAKFKNATGPTNTNMRPWTTTHSSNRTVGRNDGYVQQPKTSKQGGQNATTQTKSVGTSSTKKTKHETVKNSISNVR